MVQLIDYLIIMLTNYDKEIIVVSIVYFFLNLSLFN